MQYFAAKRTGTQPLLGSIRGIQLFLRSETHVGKVLVASLVSQVAKTTFGLAHGVMKPRWWLLEAPFPKLILKLIPEPVAPQEQIS